MVLGTPQPVQRALSESGIYTISIPNLLQSQQVGTLADLPVQQPEVQEAIQKAFPPALLEQYSNTVITATYDWVQGRSQSPNFQIDLTEAKVNFANNIAAYVQQRSAALPICTTAPSTTEINPYTLSCRPRQASPEAIATQAKQEIMSSGFLENSVLTADTIKDSNGRPLSEQLQMVPKTYAWIIRIMYGTGIAALLLIALIALLRRQEWRMVLRRMGALVATIGIVSGLIAWGSSYAIGKAADKLLASASTHELIQTKVIAIAHLLVDNLRHWWLGYGVTLAILGIIMWLIGKFAKRRPQVIVEHAPLVKQDTPLTDRELPESSLSPDRHKAHPPIEPPHSPPTSPAS